LGSDFGGSVRIPSAFCGLYGLKSTFNSLNVIDGTSPFTESWNTRFAMLSLGPLARTPDDLELFWNVLKDAKINAHRMQKIDWKPASEKTLSQYKIAWIDEWKTNEGTIKISNDVKQKLQQLLDSLKNNGVALEKKSPEIYNEMRQSFLATLGSMTSENQPWLLRKLIKMDMQKMRGGSPDYVAFDQSMDDATDERWKEVQDDSKKLGDTWVEFFKQYDFFILPADVRSCV
jgi:amidase